MHRQKEGQTDVGKSLTQQREETDKEMGTGRQRDPRGHHWADVSRGQGAERELQVRQTQRDPQGRGAREGQRAIQTQRGGAYGQMGREAAVTRGALGMVCGSLNAAGGKAGFQGGAVRGVQGVRKDRVLGGSGAHQPLKPESGRRVAGTLRGPHLQLPIKPPSRRPWECGVGQCPSEGRRCQALVSMALPQGPADGSLPTGDPTPSEGTPGPSRAPASPAATKRRALLRELEAQVQAAYGQVKGAGVWGHPQLRALWGNSEDPTA